MSQPNAGRSEPPALWTSWRDERDGTVVTVVEVRHWNERFAVSPPGGHGTVSAMVERRAWRTRRCGISQREFEDHFTLIYDPHTGYDAQVIIDRLDGVAA